MLKDFNDQPASSASSHVGIYSKLLEHFSFFESIGHHDSIVTPDVELLRPGNESAISTVHYAINGGIRDILASGLKSREQLAQEGKFHRLNHLDDYNYNIYFRPPLSSQKSGDESFIKQHRGRRVEWIAIDVNPRKTYAYDGDYRVSNNPSMYYGSRILLQDLIDAPRAGSWEVIVRTNVISPQWFSDHSHQFKFVHRHDSQEDQTNFDKSFGLTLT